MLTFGFYVTFISGIYVSIIDSTILLIVYFLLLTTLTLVGAFATWGNKTLQIIVFCLIFVFGVFSCIVWGFFFG